MFRWNHTGSTPWPRGRLASPAGIDRFDHAMHGARRGAGAQTAIPLVTPQKAARATSGEMGHRALTGCTASLTAPVDSSSCRNRCWRTWSLRASKALSPWKMFEQPSVVGYECGPRPRATGYPRRGPATQALPLFVPCVLVERTTTDPERPSDLRSAILGASLGSCMGCRQSRSQSLTGGAGGSCLFHRWRGSPCGQFRGRWPVTRRRADWRRLATI